MGEKKKWILWGGKTFGGLSNLFKRTLTIVPATTTQRIFDEETGSYERYGKIELTEVIDALKSILMEEGIQIKLDRPKIILKRSLTNTTEVLKNERTKRSVDELVADLEKLGIKVSVNSNSIMTLLSSRLESLKNRLKRDLYSQIKDGLDGWKPSVSVKDRIKGLWPKEWWGSEKFGAKAVQEELRDRWKTEVEDLLRESIKPKDIKRTINDEADSISKLLEATFKSQLAELQQQAVRERLSKGVSLESFDGTNLNLTGSGQALETAINRAVSEVQYSIVDDIIGIFTFDAIIASLLGIILNPLGSAVFFAIRRWMSGQAEEKKAKQEIEEQILRIADEASAELQEQVADKLRDSVQKSVDSIAQVIRREGESLSKLLQALDGAITTVTEIRERLEDI